MTITVKALSGQEAQMIRLQAGILLGVHPRSSYGGVVQRRYGVTFKVAELIVTGNPLINVVALTE
jgi:hypothetical protein